MTYLRDVQGLLRCGVLFARVNSSCFVDGAVMEVSVLFTLIGNRSMYACSAAISLS